MSVVVRNERDKPYRFVDDNRRQRVLDPGQVAVLTETELEQVPLHMRGPGEVNVLFPSEGSGDSNRTKFDYYDPGAGQFEVRYLGIAQQGDAEDEPVWTVKRFGHTQFGAEFLVTDIQILNDVRWDERAALGWT